MNFTLNNHLCYDIGGRKYGYRENSIEPYTVYLGKVDPDRYLKSSYKDELHRTAKCVLDDLGKDLVVFLSGGTDSEIVVRNFLSIGYKPRCVTIKFENDYNDKDVLESIEIAKDLDVKLDIIDFNVKDFYNSGEAKEFGNSIQCTQITYLTVYKNILKLGYPAVMGGESLLTRQVEPDNSYWYYTLRENEDASAMRFSLKYNLPLVNEWFSYTPELLLYYLEYEDIVKLVSTKFNYKLTSVSSKNEILQKLYPEIRKKKKTHGFESLLAFNYEAYRGIAKDQISRLNPWLDGIPINDAINILKGQHGSN